MDDAPAVRKGDGVADLAENEQQAIQREVAQGRGILAAQIVQDGLERAALHELHRVEKRRSIFPHDVVDGHDVRMRELREHLGLAQETQAHLRVGIRAGVHDFHGDGAREFRILRGENAAHAAARDLGADAVILRAEHRRAHHRGGLRHRGTVHLDGAVVGGIHACVLG